MSTISPMSDRDRLTGYGDVWWQAVDGFTHLLEQLPAVRWSTPTDPAGGVGMDREAFVVAAGGRRTAGDVSVLVSGDEELATRIPASMAVTP